MLTKTSELSLISLLSMLFGTVLAASAAVMNYTNNLTSYTAVNETFSNGLVLNEFSNLSNTSITENTALNESVNLTLNGTIENETIRIINSTSNIPIADKPTAEDFTLANFTLNDSTLAKVFNEDSIDFDRDYRLSYLQENNNFSAIAFKNIDGKEDFKLKVGAVQDKIRGVSINNENFVIDLLYCESQGRYCAFRINGVPAVRLQSLEESGNPQKGSFDIDGNYALKVNTIIFDYCGNRRFCHLGYEGYDIVNVSVERK